MKKTLMTLFAFTMFPACAVDSAPAARDDLGTTEQALSGWRCVQHCADGHVSIGAGGTPDEAYQNMPGCGPDGGAINCDQGPVIIPGKED